MPEKPFPHFCGGLIFLVGVRGALRPFAIIIARGYITNIHRGPVNIDGKLQIGLFTPVPHSPSLRSSPLTPLLPHSLAPSLF